MKSNYIKSNTAQNVVQTLCLPKFHRAEDEDENTEQEGVRFTLNFIFFNVTNPLVKDDVSD